MSPDAIAAAGAFLSGVASVLSAAWYTRRQRRRSEADCQRRIDEIDRALHEGIEIERTRNADRQTR